MVEFPTIPTGVGFAGSNGPINQDLIGLSSMEILDQIIVRAKAMGLKIILDNHRSESGSGPEENGLWFTSQFPESSWIADWASLAARYSNNSAVIGMDLRNEPHSVWRKRSLLGLWRRTRLAPGCTTCGRHDSGN